jgi:hypothetical protein
VPRRYGPAAPVAGGTDPAGYNTGGTAHPEQPVPIKATTPTTSAPSASTNRATVGSDPGQSVSAAVGIGLTSSAIVKKLLNDLSHSYDIHFKFHFRRCVLYNDMNKIRLHLHMF